MDKPRSIIDVRLAWPGQLPLPELRALYESAFPPEEQRPWAQQEQYIRSETLQTLLVTSDNGFAGFAFFWLLPGFIFVEHIAIVPALRGCGAGSNVLQFLQKQYAAIVLETEPAAMGEFALRRLEFYRRLGFVPFEGSYVQPAYSKELSPQPMLLLHNNHPHRPPFGDIVDHIYAQVYKVKSAAGRILRQK